MTFANALNQNTVSNQPGVNGITWDFDVVSFTVLSAIGLTLTAGNAAPSDLILASAQKDILLNGLLGKVESNSITFNALATNAVTVTAGGATGGDLNLNATLGNIYLTTAAGSTVINSATDVSLQPTAKLRARLDSVVGAGAPPAISPPAGYSLVVREDATGIISYLIP